MTGTVKDFRCGPRREGSAWCCLPSTLRVYAKALPAERSSRYSSGMDRLPFRHVFLLAAVLVVAMASVVSASLMAPDRNDPAMAAYMAIGGTVDDLCGDGSAHGEHHCPFCRLLSDPPDIRFVPCIRRATPTLVWQDSGISLPGPMPAIPTSPPARRLRKSDPCRLEAAFLSDRMADSECRDRAVSRWQRCVRARDPQEIPMVRYSIPAVALTALACADHRGRRRHNACRCRNRRDRDHRALRAGDPAEPARGGRLPDDHQYRRDGRYARRCQIGRGESHGDPRDGHGRRHHADA